jgi:hypothetical protein
MVKRLRKKHAGDDAITDLAEAIATLVSRLVEKGNLDSADVSAVNDAGLSRFSRGQDGMAPACR